MATALEMDGLTADDLVRAAAAVTTVDQPGDRDVADLVSTVLAHLEPRQD